MKFASVMILIGASAVLMPHLFGQGFYGQGTGGVIFPINNPYVASDMQQLAAFEAGCRRIAIATATPQAQASVGQFPGLSTSDGSAQLFQATLQSYQAQTAQNQQFAQWGMNMMANPSPESARAFQMLGNMADAGLSSARIQSQSIESNQRRSANLELYNATGKEHWQYSNRPVTPGAEQAAYDQWNQVNRRLSR